MKTKLNSKGYPVNYINITGIPKDLLLWELYKNASTIMGFPVEMLFEDAKRMTDSKKSNFDHLRLDYLCGRAMKVDLRGDFVDFSEYNSERIYEEKKLGHEKKRTAEQIIELLKGLK